jgi:polyribonucleotide nucleotidyltransferase
MKEETVKLTLGDRELTISTGKMARQADGSVVVRSGDTAVLVTACAQKEARDLPFLPLTCEYREYTYAAGKIPGGFFKREGRPTEKETLTSRLMDRPIRPLFPDNYRFETQVIAMVQSAEPEINPDVLALIGSSAALLCSDIDFHIPIGAVRVGLIEDQFVTNPTAEQLNTSSLNMLISASEEAILMVEAGAQEVPEDRIVEALEYGHSEIRKIVEAIRDLAQRQGKVKRETPKVEQDEELYKFVEENASQEIWDALKVAGSEGKLASEVAMKTCKEKFLSLIPEEEEAKRTGASLLFGKVKEAVFRENMLNQQQRPDGRSFDEVRPITTEVGLLPRAHGSALFTRGETQALASVTLGTGEDAQRVDGLTGDSSKTFMLHYNFPPFSVGEVRFLRGPGRREIGHGALAERSISPILPKHEDFPYTIRIVSDILESNGSSSMATVCGGIMALQDAGVPVRSPVAGIAMGLVKEGDNYAILSDIAGAEDHYGDMDFKVAGTREGITALQMDIKTSGVTRQIMSEALQQAKKGRLGILDRMAATLAEPREDISGYAPRITTLQIPTDKIGAVIGPGGKVIRGMIEEYGVKIDINDDGTVQIYSAEGTSAQKAADHIKGLTASPEIGKNYMGTVVKVVDFGAFVEILPGTEGLLHISQIAEHRINDIHAEVKRGDKMMVKVLDIDGQKKIRLSRRAVLEEG